MLEIQRFVNELMTSNCYVIYDDSYNDCMVIDPASKDCTKEISFFIEHGLKPSYVLLTHEHTDHTWGANTLIDKYDSKIVCSKVCAENIDKESSAYFRLYFNDRNYEYRVARVDIILEDVSNKLKWHDYDIEFIPSPGHSMGSVCIKILDNLFTGDAWMQYKPYINRRNGSKIAYVKSLTMLKEYAKGKRLTIYPGHGECFKYEL